MKKKIDIIITVYNTPINDLKRCIESIEKQTYKNWIVYIIDDGSKENIKNWIDNNLKENNKFKIIHIKNMGVSNARNLGISMSNGELITFCDADDSMSPKFLEEALYIIDKYNVDLVIGSTEVIHKNYTQICNANREKLYDKNNLQDILSYILSGKPKKTDDTLNLIYAGRVYPKLYRRNILMNVRFDNKLKLHEDNLFSIDIVANCKSIYVTNKIWYQYYQNDYSITHVKYNEELLQQEILFANKIVERKEKNIYNGAINAYYFRLFNIAQLYIKMLMNSDIVVGIDKKLKNLFSNEIFNDIKFLKLKEFDKIDKKSKLLFTILKLNNTTVKIKILTIIIKLFKTMQ